MKEKEVTISLNAEEIKLARFLLGSRFGIHDWNPNDYEDTHLGMKLLDAEIEMEAKKCKIKKS